MAYAPGSFTKNFAWHGRGFSKLHTAIRNGFHGGVSAVTREVWRSRSLLNDSDFYIAANFFLFNVIEKGADFIPVDELVIQAVSTPHSIAFDRLALFALNLSLGGKRTGRTNGVEFPALWASEFVRELLWKSGRWQRESLEPREMDAFFRERIRGVGRVKCRMNYRHMFELARFLPAANSQINTDAESWLAPALFLAWDRRQMAGGGFSVSIEDLISESVHREDHKLLGITDAEFRFVSRPIAAAYRDAGGLGRTARLQPPVTHPEPLNPSPPDSPTRQQTADDLAWLTAVGAEGAVERHIQQRLAQRRDRAVAAKLKALYGHACMACTARLLVGLSPERFYAETAHVRPLGKPHDGPDIVANMIVLCPNHHLQFDRGVLSVRMKHGVPVFVSRISGDPINDRPLTLRHTLDPAYVEWHHSYYLTSPES